MLFLVFASHNSISRQLFQKKPSEIWLLGVIESLLLRRLSGRVCHDDRPCFTHVLSYVTMCVHFAFRILDFNYLQSTKHGLAMKVMEDENGARYSRHVNVSQMERMKVDNLTTQEIHNTSLEIGDKVSNSEGLAFRVAVFPMFILGIGRMGKKSKTTKRRKRRQCNQHDIPRI